MKRFHVTALTLGFAFAASVVAANAQDRFSPGISSPPAPPSGALVPPSRPSETSQRRNGAIQDFGPGPERRLPPRFPTFELDREPAPNLRALPNPGFRNDRPYTSRIPRPPLGELRDDNLIPSDLEPGSNCPFGRSSQGRCPNDGGWVGEVPQPNFRVEPCTFRQRLGEGCAWERQQRNAVSRRFLDR